MDVIADWYIAKTSMLLAQDPRLILGLGFFVGMLLGHYLQLGRDKRKEFNALTADAFDGLHKQQAAVRGGNPGQRVVAPWRRIEPMYPAWERRLFRRRFEAYERASNANGGEHNDWAGTVTFDPAAMKAVDEAITKLLPMLRPR